MTHSTTASTAHSTSTPMSSTNTTSPPRPTSCKFLTPSRSTVPHELRPPKDQHRGATLTQRDAPALLSTSSTYFSSSTPTPSISTSTPPSATAAAFWSSAQLPQPALPHGYSASLHHLHLESTPSSSPATPSSPSSPPPLQIQNQNIVNHVNFKSTLLPGWGAYCARRITLKLIYSPCLHPLSVSP